MVHDLHVLSGEGNVPLIFLGQLPRMFCIWCYNRSLFLDPDEPTNIREAYQICAQLPSENLQGFHGGKVTDVTGFGCTLLTYLEDNPRAWIRGS